MTREELILYGKDYLHDLETACCKIEEKHKEFVRESIKALEQETVSRETYESEYLARKQAEYELWKIKEQQPSKDCVSRKSLLDKLDPLYKEKIKTAPDNMAEGFLQVSNLIKYEPPVTPTRKKGKWIEEKYQDYDDEYYWMYRCSECGRTAAHNYANITDVIKDYPFCHCGADMREVKE